MKYEIMFDEALKASKKSEDPDRAVGAVIFLEEHIVGTGANAVPQGLLDARDEIQETIKKTKSSKYFLLEHAERNAINNALKSGFPMKGATLACTLHPCADCARAIVSAGISKVVIPKHIPNTERDEKWKDHYNYSLEIFRLANISIIRI